MGFSSFIESESFSFTSDLWLGREVTHSFGSLKQFYAHFPNDRYRVSTQLFCCLTDIFPVLEMKRNFIPDVFLSLLVYGHLIVLFCQEIKKKVSTVMLKPKKEKSKKKKTSLFVLGCFSFYDCPFLQVTYTNSLFPLAELEGQQFPLVQSCVFPKLVAASDDVRKASAEAERRLDAHVLMCRFH